MYIHSSPYEVNGSNIPGVPVRTGCCRHGETIEIVAEIVGRLCRCVCVCMGGGGGGGGGVWATQYVCVCVCNTI